MRYHTCQSKYFIKHVRLPATQRTPRRALFKIGELYFQVVAQASLGILGFTTFLRKVVECGFPGAPIVPCFRSFLSRFREGTGNLGPAWKLYAEEQNLLIMASQSKGNN